MPYCVYVHTNKITGKQYVGQTKQRVEYRWRSGKGYETSDVFYHAIQKYGWENFSHEIIADGLTLDEANALESAKIAELNTVIPNGYNILYGGGNRSIPGSVREKIRKAHIGMTHVCSEKTKRKISDANRGRVFTAEMRANMSKGQTGKKQSEETKAKQSERLRQQWALGLREPLSGPSPNRKPIIATNVKTGEERRFPYISKAAEELNIRRTDISTCLSGKQKTAHGYKFREAINELP